MLETITKEEETGQHRALTCPVYLTCLVSTLVLVSTTVMLLKTQYQLGQRSALHLLPFRSCLLFLYYGLTVTNKTQSSWIISLSRWRNFHGVPIRRFLPWWALRSKPTTVPSSQKTWVKFSPASSSLGSSKKMHRVHIHFSRKIAFFLKPALV